MPGLIPLMLRPSEPPKRSSPCSSPIRTDFNQRQSPCPSPTRTRFQHSQIPCPSLVRINLDQSHLRSASTGTVPTRRPNQPKRYSLLPPADLPANLPSIPVTPAEWKQAITEVKQQHLNKRYRACSARCAEILDNLKDPSQVEPAYLIYLHFYAAASMEMCTRPLPLTSPYRAALLQQARNHYDRATCLIQAAEDSVAIKTRSNSVSSSRSGCSSNLHSPSDSINSLSSVSTASGSTWTADDTNSATHSPSPSLYSLDGTEPPCTPPPPGRSQPAFRPCTGRGAPDGNNKKRVKKVSFSLPLCAEELAEQEREEREAAANFRFPSAEQVIIIRPDSPTLGFDDEYFLAGASLCDLPAPPLPSKSALRLRMRPPPPSPPPQPDDLQIDPDFFRVERSVHKYNQTLAHLRQQLARHSHNLGAQLVQAADIGSSRPGSPASPTVKTFETESSRASAEAARQVEKQARIERLRKTGWVRKRFDGRRYEELAREVLAELEQPKRTSSA
ncbi:hypothetical protein GE09DRAFT_163079 [Coniochaeta sp. 2T2.1]|nr:hypothetical protein GE09DRAFT_163079 [Coniochaeta sp. 2T2.1]